MFKIFKRFVKDRRGYVYYAKLEKFGRVFYVIGYTKEASLRESLVKHDNDNNVCIESIFFFTYREDAFDFFKKIRSLLRSKRRTRKHIVNQGMPLRRSDCSVAFVGDVLGLDAEIYELSDAAKESEKNSALGCLFILVGLILIPLTAGISIALVLIFLGVYAIHENYVGYGKEIKNKKPPVVPDRVKKLIDTLVY